MAKQSRPKPVSERGEQGSVKPSVKKPKRTSARSVAPPLAVPATDLLERVSDGFVAFDAGMNYTYVNQKGAEMLGRTPADLVGKNYWVEFPEAKGTPFAEAYVRALKTQEPLVIEDYYAPWDRWFENRIYPSKEGISIFFTEITERKRAENELRCKQRALTVLSACNQALIRAQDEQSLLDEICAICVERGGYRMAWIGYAEHDENKTVRPVAQTGFEAGYLDRANITWADVEHGRGPTGTAIRTGKTCLARNIPDDPNYEPWRAAAIQRGYVSSIALPLNQTSEVWGALSIYAAEADAFDALEVDLLSELADDLAYGLASIRSRAGRRRAEESLRETQERLSFAVHAANVGLWDWDLQTHKVRYSPEWKSQLGYEEHEIADDFSEWESRVHPDDLERATATVSGFIANPHPNYQNEFRMRHKDGSYRWILAQASLIMDDKGSPSRMVGSHVDITGSKRAEKQIRYQATLLANVNDAVLASDDKFTVTSWNKAAEQIYGWTAEEAIGQTGEALFKSEFIGKTRLEVIGELQETGQYFAEMTQSRKDGTRIYVEARATALHGADGKVIGYVSVNRNITERKQAEEQLRENEARLHAIIENAGGTIWAIDAECRLTMANTAYFQSTKAALGHEIKNGDEMPPVFLPANFRAEWIEKYERALRGETVREETTIPTAAGGILFREYALNPIRDAEGKVIGAACFGWDITERKRAEEALRESNERLKKVLEVETVGVMFWDLTTGVMTDANDTFLNLMGYSRREVEAGDLTWQKLTPPEHMETSLTEIRQFQATGRVGPYEKEYLRKDGTRQWLVFAGSSLGGNASVEFCVDITERKHAEEARQRAEESYTRLFDSMLEGFAHYKGIYDGDRLVDLRVLEINPIGAEISGMPRETQIGRTWRELWTGMDENIFAIYQQADGKGEFVQFVNDNNLTGRSYDVRISNVAPAEFIVTFTDITERKRAEEERFRLTQIMELSLNEIYMFDAKTLLFTYINHGARLNLGYLMDELRAMTPLDLKPEYTEPSFRELIRPLILHEREMLVFETVHLRKDKTVYPAEVHLQLIESGAANQFVAIIHDITERKRAEEELRELETRFSTIFHASPIGINLFRISDGRSVDANDAFLELIGYPREELIGHAAAELDLFVDTEARRVWMETLRATGKVRGVDAQLRRKSGERRDALASIETLELGGERMGLVIAADITERRRAEEALGKSLERLQKVLEVETVGVIFWDLTSGVMTDANDTFLNLMGYSRRNVEAGELTWQKLTPPEYMEVSLAEIRKFQETGHVGPYEKEYFRKDGSRQWMVFAGSSLGGNACVEFCVDISDRKRAEIDIQRRLNELEMLHQASLTFSQLQDLNALGQEVLEHLEKMMRYERGAIALRDETSGELQLMAHARMSLDERAYRKEIERVQGFFEIPQGITRWVAEHGEVVRAGDVKNDPRYLEADPAIKSEMAVPLKVGERLIGALNVESVELDAFSEHDERLLVTVANVAAVAIQNSRLLKEARFSRDRLAELSRRLVETRENEARAIGRELHDQIGQMLTAMKITLDLAGQLPVEAAAKKIGQAKELIGDLLNRVSRMSLELRPPMLDDLGLIPALVWHVNHFQEQSGIAVEFKHNGVEGIRFTSEIETTAYRVVQESLTNVARHARAARVKVEVRKRGAEMEIHIEDDGVGFDPQAALALNRGLGGMRERVGLVGGTFEIESEPGKGAWKTIRLPWKERA